MAGAIFVDGGFYSYFEVDKIEEKDFLLLPDGQMFFVERLDEPNANTKIVPVGANSPVPLDARIVKLEVHDRVN